MVSQRCIVSVKTTFDKLNIRYDYVKLGEANIFSELSATELSQLKESLTISGFEILNNKKSTLSEKIKITIIEMIHNKDGLPEINTSYYIADKLNHDYTYLSNVFSEVNEMTIERFIIMHKIERVKELLQDDELSIKEISYKLNYSSLGHLSAQFKKITGMTPTVYKKQKNKPRYNLEDL
jgi:AraC-like DNA-binding protein